VIVQIHPFNFQNQQKTPQNQFSQKTMDYYSELSDIELPIDPDCINSMVETIFPEESDNLGPIKKSLELLRQFETEFHVTMRQLVKDSQFTLATQLEAAWAEKRKHLEYLLKNALSRHSNQYRKDQSRLSTKLESIVDRYHH
jgi:hypothetical protein